jgi:hypothetical protein
MTPHAQIFAGLERGLEPRSQGIGWGNVLVAVGLVGAGVFGYFVYRNVWAGMGPLRGAKRAFTGEDR